jgi:putative spermidine/putrescine transport system ATP-binding protein
VYRRPRTRFVADFIGRANLIDVNVVRDAGVAEDGERSYLVAADQLGTLGAVGETGLSGRRAMLIRPHNINVRLADNVGSDDVGAERTGSALRGRVGALTYTGDSVGYRILLPSGEIAAEVVPSAAPLPGLGDSVVVSWAPTDGYLLPSRSEVGAA